MKKKYFRNKTILITGSSSGLGKEFAIQLSKFEQNLNLILVARRKERLEELKTNLLDNGLNTVTIISQDLTEQDGPEKIFKKVESLQQNVDILINNAGFALSDEFDSLGLQEYMNMVDLNIKAVIKLIYLFLPVMKNKKSGAILNVSSILGALPTPDLAVYSGTKAFILSFSEALWKELKRYNIRVTTLVSVGIETEFFNKVHKNKFRYLPIQKPEKVAKKALNALGKKKRLAYTGNRYAFLLHSKRLLPQRLIIWMMDIFYDEKKRF